MLNIQVILVLLEYFDLVSGTDYPGGGKRIPWGCWWRGKWLLWAYFIHKDMICFPWSLIIVEKSGSFFLKTNLVGRCLLWCFLFCLIFSLYIIRHHPELYYFHSSYVYFKIIIMVLLGDYVFFIICQYCLFSLNFSSVFLHILKEMMNITLTELYTAATRKISLDYCWI